MNVVYLGIGGNIGDIKNNLNKALSQIRVEVGEITAQSYLYETEPWGAFNQQNYLNACICVETKLSSLELIKTLLSIESKLGRIRDADIGYQSRTIDIDILFFNNEVIDYPELQIPHPRLHLRKFVLIPLCDIAPKHIHPLLNQSLQHLLEVCDDGLEVKRVEE